MILSPAMTSELKPKSLTVMVLGLNKGSWANCKMTSLNFSALSAAVWVLALTRTRKSVLPSNFTGAPGSATVKPGGSSFGSQARAKELQTVRKMAANNNNFNNFIKLLDVDKCWSRSFTVAHPAGEAGLKAPVLKNRFATFFHRACSGSSFPTGLVAVLTGFLKIGFGSNPGGCFIHG